MPELPEVETVRRAMEAHVVGRRVEKVWCSNLRLREPLSRRRLAAVEGRQILSCERRAKYLLLHLEGARTLLVHLGMSGNLLVTEERRKHDHVIFYLDDGPPLVYHDPRRFGIVLSLTAKQLTACSWLQGLGVEPLSADFDIDLLAEACKGRQRPIKSLLLDGHVVVGVGNIYASETLFVAAIRPTTAAGRISRGRLARLVDAVRSTLQRAIDHGGTTIRDYAGAGTGGYFQRQLSVYGREGEPCDTCNSRIKSIVQSGRSTFYCPRCQR
jgi:formamidopyrimidine-DNA glycosylase